MTTNNEPHDERVYQAHKSALQEYFGKIVRVPEWGDERVLLANGKYPDIHGIVLEAALWVRQDRPGHSSKFNTYMRKAVEDGRDGYSVVAAGAYANDYLDAIEWIGDESEDFGNERIEWLDLPKVIIREEELTDAE